MTSPELRVKYRLILCLVNGATKTLHTAKRGRIVHLAHKGNWKKADLTVFYEVSSPKWEKPHKTFNRGEYTTPNDLLDALREFTEDELIDLLLGVAAA